MCHTIWAGAGWVAKLRGGECKARRTGWLAFDAVWAAEVGDSSSPLLCACINTQMARLRPLGEVFDRRYRLSRQSGSDRDWESPAASRVLHVGSLLGRWNLSAAAAAAAAAAIVAAAAAAGASARQLAKSCWHARRAATAFPRFFVSCGKTAQARQGS